jgi:hypothetical protein
MDKKILKENEIKKKIQFYKDGSNWKKNQIKWLL